MDRTISYQYDGRRTHARARARHPTERRVSPRRPPAGRAGVLERVAVGRCGRRTDGVDAPALRGVGGEGGEVLAGGDGVLDVPDGRGARPDAVGRLRDAGPRLSAPAGQGFD